MAAEHISDEMIEHISILAKLELDDAEKEIVKHDMGNMLGYVNKLMELDTDGMEPMSHIFELNNVFRDDIVEDKDGRHDVLKNAPEKRMDGICVPKTI